jgi:hypothetical protein
MSALTAIATLRAIESGRAARTTTVRHAHVGDHPFVLIPLNLAGEACAPLAALCGAVRDNPRLLVVPQPRNRDERFSFAARLADLVLDHLDSCRQDTETFQVGRPPEIRTRFTEAPQIFVPNPGGIGFLRVLGRSTRLRRTDGPFAVPASVPTLGKWLTWFGDQAEFPGSSLLLAMTEVLTAHWATGQSGIEDGNLGALLGWIDPPQGLDGATAALLAEDPAHCPPAGPSTDPVFDQRELAPAISAYEGAVGDAAQAGALRILTEALRRQLIPTWELMWRGIDLLGAIPAGDRVAGRWAYDRTAFTGYTEYLAGDGWPQPRRDTAARAARRLASLEDATIRYRCERAFDDPLVMADYELDGTAFTGTVIAREPDRMVAGSRSPLLRPAITLLVEHRPAIEPGVPLSSPARPGQKAVILAVRQRPDGYEVDLELSGGFQNKRKPPAPAGTVPDTDEELCYTTLSSDTYFGAIPDAEDTPWTHGGSPVHYEPTDDDAEEEWR